MFQQVVEEVGGGGSSWVEGGVSGCEGGGDDGDGLSGPWGGCCEGQRP